MSKINKSQNVSKIHSASNLTSKKTSKLNQVPSKSTLKKSNLVPSVGPKIFTHLPKETCNKLYTKVAALSLVKKIKKIMD